MCVTFQDGEIHKKGEVRDLSDLLTVTYQRAKPPKTEGAYALVQDGTIFQRDAHMRRVLRLRVIP